MEKRFRSLKIYNTIVGIILFVEGIIMWSFSNNKSLPVTTNYLKWNAITRIPVPTTEKIADVRLAPLVAVFLLLSGLFLLGAATLWNKKYNEWLGKGMNLFRWMEYSITSSLMIVIIAMLCGIYDLSTLILIFALNACMILFGWMMEVHNQTTQKVNSTAFIFGCFAGIVPWVVLGLYFFSAIASNGSAVPKFVYYIFWSLFAFFNIFAINMVLQYKKIGKWRDYIYGEYAFITLSLLAKSILAWLVWGGTLR
jgi:sensor histidine kinase YesM